MLVGSLWRRLIDADMRQRQPLLLNVGAPFIYEFFLEPLQQVLPYVDYLIGNQVEILGLGAKLGFGVRCNEHSRASPLATVLTCYAPCSSRPTSSRSPGGWPPWTRSTSPARAPSCARRVPRMLSLPSAMRYVFAPRIRHFIAIDAQAHVWLRAFVRSFVRSFV